MSDSEQKQKDLKKRLKEQSDEESDNSGNDDDDKQNDSSYGVTVEELRIMFNKRDMQKLKRIGGSKEMASALNSSLEGLNKENVQPSIRQQANKFFKDNIFFNNKFSNQLLFTALVITFQRKKNPSPFSSWQVEPKQYYRQFKHLYLKFFPLVFAIDTALCLLTNEPLQIMECFEDPVLRILLAATFVSLIVGILTDGLETGWFESAAIFIAVGIIVVVTTTNNYMKEMKFRELYAKADERKVSVNRSGETKQIDINDLVVGDIMYFETGEDFCIDGILTKGYSVKCDESAMTGQSDLIQKDIFENCFSKTTKDEHSNKTPFLISGTKVLEGSGEVLVCAVGKNTVYNKIKELVQQEKEDTPLQIKLADLADDIGKVGMISAALTVLAASLHLIYDRMREHQEGDPSIWNGELVKELLDFLILGITIIVVAVPEGLPLAVTIALAYSSQKMFEEQNLVRFLAACETMGGADNICSDKTGTLTINKMTLTNIYACNKSSSKIDKKMFDSKTADLICLGICVNSSALPAIGENGEVEQTGNKTECALLKFSNDLGYDYNKYRGVKAQNSEKNKIIRVCPFSSKLKLMSCVYEHNTNQARVFVKGAPDYLVGNCTKFYQEGDDQDFTSDHRKKIDETIIAYADKSLRTLLLAYKDISKKEALESSEEDLTKNLTFLAIVGIQDPLRPEINDAIKKCKKAGITVRMVTGDRRETAVAIGKDAGIIDKDFKPSEQNQYTVMDGEEFEKFVGGKKTNKQGEEFVGNLDNMKIIDKNLRILARSRPEDKYLMVLGLKQLSHVVAVTGDGTNDAPALKKSDIGFAMGIAGTKVAQEASGIVLLDDNFASIITAIKWGRNVFECIRKFLQFQLSVNIVAMFMAFLGGVVLRESPLNAIEMLWVNLIMDTFASLALATESPSEQLLNRQPYSKYEYIITPVMFRNVVMMGLFQCVYLTWFLFYGEQVFDCPSGRQNPKWTHENGKHYTLFFNIFVYLQVFNEINARKLKKDELNVFEGFFKNPIFALMLLITVIVQTLLVQYGGYAVRMVPLSINEHITCILIGLLSLVIGYLIQIIPEGFYEKFDLFTKQIEFNRDEEKEKEKERLKIQQEKEREQMKAIKKLNKKQSGDVQGGDDDDDEDDDKGSEKNKSVKSRLSTISDQPATFRQQAKENAKEKKHKERIDSVLKQFDSKTKEQSVQMVDKKSDQKDQKESERDLEKAKPKQKEKSKKKDEEKSPKKK